MFTFKFTLQLLIMMTELLTKRFYAISENNMFLEVKKRQIVDVI